MLSNDIVSFEQVGPEPEIWIIHRPVTCSSLHILLYNTNPEWNQQMCSLVCATKTHTILKWHRINIIMTLMLIQHRAGWCGQCSQETHNIEITKYRDIAEMLIWRFSIVHQLDQGPVVQSVISLTSLLRVISLTVLADSIYNTLIFFAEKMWVAFALQKLLTFFQQKISAYLRITRCKF